MKKEVVVFLLSITLAVTAFAEKPAPRTIVTTFYPMQIAVLNLTAGVAGVRVVNLAAPTAGCLHDYHLTAGDMAMLSKADIVVANGAGMESFLETLTRRWPALPVINASEGLDLLSVAGQPNAHVWVSPARHIMQLRTIVEGLVRWDPGHAGAYRRNGELYRAKLEALKRHMESTLGACRERKVMTFHEAFAYFASDFNLTVVAVIEREPGAEPSAGELAQLIRRVRETRVKAIFVEPQYPAKSAAVIARETGATLYTLDPVVSGPVDPDAYLAVMARNEAELKRALTR
jgi:zinc transport system substrate-binding protein